MSRGDLLDIARNVARAARDGEQVEAYVVRTRDTDVEVFDGEVESLTTASVEGIGIRVIAGRAPGSRVGGIARARRHRRDVEGSARQRRVRRARRVVRARVARRRQRLAPPDLDLWRDELASVPTEEKVRIALDLERATKAADPRIRNVESASYGDALAEAALANSLGVEAHTRRTTCSASAVALADDGSGTQSGYGFVAGRTLVRSRSRLDPARRRARARAGCSAPSPRPAGASR